MRITLQSKDIRSFPSKNIVPIYLTEKKEVEVVKENNPASKTGFQSGQGRKAIYFGVGSSKELTRRKLITISRRIIHIAKQHKVKRIALNFSDFLFPKLKNISYEETAALLAQNFEMANFEFVRFKTPPKEGWNTVEEIVVCSALLRAPLERGLKKGKIIGEEINKCRVLANTPGGDMTPRVLADEAKKASKGTKVKVKVLGKKEMRKLKMGAILGVAQGSSEAPKFIILEYFAGRKGEKPIVLLGKGVTFDTGGLNLKPTSGISDMHLDMSGGAAVIYTILIAARLKLKKNIVGLIPAVENMPSGSSYRPGDVLRGMSGKTIEVLNTDAEGRVILSDGITYAKRYNPRLLVDVATLTGAALVAVGQKASVIMTKDEKLERLCMKLGEESGEYVWPLPLWEEYEEDVRGNFADVANDFPTRGSYGGAINGGMFLYQFAKDIKAPWLHIDMAPRMTSANGDHLAKGAAGAPIRLLVKLIEEY